MPLFDPSTQTVDQNYHALTSVVVPRPIAWVGTRSSEGVNNIAPYSFFGVVSVHPPMIYFTSIGAKDSYTNIVDTEVFTVSLTTKPLMPAVNATAVDAPPEVDEFEIAELTAVDAHTINAPRVGESPAWLECRLHKTMEFGNGLTVFGEVVQFGIDDELWKNERVDQENLDAIGRLSAGQYAVDAEVFKMPRPDPWTA